MDLGPGRAGAEDMPGLSFDQRKVATRSCPDCGREYEFVTAFVLRNGDAYGVYYASIGGHVDQPTVNLDILIGGWGDDHRKRVTFSCQLRPQGAGAVDAPAALDKEAAVGEGSVTLGQTLTRDDALCHPGIDEFWAIVDWIWFHDPSVARELGAGAAN
jgi:hypothetical protein